MYVELNLILNTSLFVSYSSKIQELYCWIPSPALQPVCIGGVARVLQHNLSFSTKLLKFSLYIHIG